MPMSVFIPSVMTSIAIHSWSFVAPNSIYLTEKRCAACGNSFHLPKKNLQSNEILCRICRQHNHNSNLYQVLTDN